ncbi:MAG: acetyl-CoA carboxylase, carboxyltransferase subunit beta [Gemella sp.]|nr:acetyl-CoA carboxylase, carboxyltransferase subunit beta [Gemella sp.]
MRRLFNTRKDKISKLKIYRNKNRVFEPKEIPDNILLACPVCNEKVHVEDWQSNLQVCPKCGYHKRLGARERLAQLTDTNYFKEFDAEVESPNTENFYQYDEKLQVAKEKSGLTDAIVCGIAKVNGIKTIVAVMDSNFMMGSMGMVVGEKLTRAIEYATDKKLPLLVATTSGGARMQEGIISLMQMAKTSAALKRHSDKGLLYITLLTDPTTGGVSASFAMLGDIILAEPKALIGFAGKRVIEKTINEKLPEDFQTSEFLLEKGFIDMIVERKDLKSTIYKLLTLHGEK